MGVFCTEMVIEAIGMDIEWSLSILRKEEVNWDTQNFQGQVEKRAPAKDKEKNHQRGKMKTS